MNSEMEEGTFFAKSEQVGQEMNTPEMDTSRMETLGGQVLKKSVNVQGVFLPSVAESLQLDQLGNNLLQTEKYIKQFSNEKESLDNNIFYFTIHFMCIYVVFLCV